MHTLQSHFSSKDELIALQAELISVLRSCSAELDLKALLQSVVDSATRMTKASYGAFFLEDDKGGFTLYALSGADEAAFRAFPPVRGTPIFAPTFIEGKTLRSGNILKDSRYGKNAPHKGMPTGHPPVVSYLAVPVMREKKIYGALLFAHVLEDQFTEVHEKIAQAIASQASVALDNAILYKQAQEAIRAREDFLSIAAHEIRTPLTPLALQLELMSRRAAALKDDSERAVFEKSLNITNRQVKRLARLVDELLDVSRIRVGRLTLEYERCDIISTIHDIVERYRIQAAEAMSTIEVVSPSDEILVDFDRFRFQQVLVNILSNALKYAPGSDVKIGIAEARDTIHIRIVDKGPGISIEDQGRIFNRFERASVDKTKGGLGLGLYICREIIQAHGGNIDVISEVGKGTTFTLSLPLRQRRQQE